MSDIKLRQLENKAIERVREAFTVLIDQAVLPAIMTLPVGEVITDVGTHIFELRVTLSTAVKSFTDGLAEVRDETANAALTCSAACRYNNGVLVIDPACETHRP